MAAGADLSPTPLTATAILSLDSNPRIAITSSKSDSFPTKYSPYSHETRLQHHHQAAASDHLSRPVSTSPPPRRLSLQHARLPYEYPQVPPRADSRPTSGVFNYNIPVPERPYYPHYHHGPHRPPYWSGFSNPSSRSSLSAHHHHQQHHRLSPRLASHPYEQLSNSSLDERRYLDSVKSPALASSVSSGKPDISPLQPPDAYITRSTYSESDLEDFPGPASPQQSPHRKPAGDPEQHTFRAWMHLSFAAPVISIYSTLYAILSVFFVFLTLPFRLCSRSEATITEQWTEFMLSPINLQRRLICFPTLVPTSDTLPVSNDEHKTGVVETNLGGGTMFLINLCSPFVSIGLAVACWVVGCFWAMSALVTDDRASSMDSNQPFTLNEKKPSDDGHNMAHSLSVWWADRWLAGGVFGATLRRRRSRASLGGMKERRRS